MAVEMFLNLGLKSNFIIFLERLAWLKMIKKVVGVVFRVC